MLKQLPAMISMDWPTLLVIFALCAMAAYFLKEYLANPPMIIFVYPVLVALSVLAQYFLIRMEMFAANKMDQWLMWTILAAIAGNITGVILVAMLASIRESWERRRLQPTSRAPSGA